MNIYNYIEQNIRKRKKVQQEIETLLGYMEDKLELGETKLIDAFIDKELTDILKIE